MSSAVLRCFAGGGQVRPQALEPLVADDARRIINARSTSPLLVGISCSCQAAPPLLNRFAALRMQVHPHLVLTSGAFHHPREHGIGGRPGNPRDAHGRRTDDRTH
ncbi:hypothetical protein [Mycobacterium sp.]|uniref:hypothetical protein n=1 Tax=Mycobacterium sp. TaxID=1785 RepID=UPI002D7F493D|nr:hypothetical protein [Mycobacterium sp.]